MSKIQKFFFADVAQGISLNTKNPPPEDCVMCHCSGTKRGNIQGLYEQGLDINAISRWTGALSGCGGCEWDIAQFLKDIDEQKKNLNTPPD